MATTMPAPATSTSLGRLEVALGLWAAAIGLVAARLYPIWRERLYIGCPALVLFGIPCPTCGGTRAMASLMAGHWLQALAWNPLVALGGIGTLVFVPYAVLVVSGRVPAPRLPVAAPSWLKWTLGLAVGLNWLYLLLWFGG